MIKLLKINLFLPLSVAVLSAGLLLVGVDQAKAVGDAYFPQDTTIALDVGTFRIVGGSDADTVTTSNTQITVTISTNQSLTIESDDRKILNNNQGYTYSCFSNKSSIIIDTTTTTKTVVITPSSDSCGSTGGSGGGGGGATTSTPTPTPVPTESPAVSPTPTPRPVPASKLTPASRGFVSLANASLEDGDVISATGSDDPDIYIVNPFGYKRLFLNPAIFAFYGHLGGFSKVKSTTSVTRDIFGTSGLFRNCETDDPKVYGVEVTGEDVGVLHWVNTTGEQAVADDSDFFNKVFCINTNEFNWYPIGSDYTSVNQIPDYSRGNIISGQSNAAPIAAGKIKVVNTIPWLNVRDGGSLDAKIIAQVLPDEEYEFLTKNSGGWYNIKKDGIAWGWVSGQYVKEI